MSDDQSRPQSVKRIDARTKRAQAIRVWRAPDLEAERSVSACSSVLLVSDENARRETLSGLALKLRREAARGKSFHPEYDIGRHLRLLMELRALSGTSRRKTKQAARGAA
ncbi:MAG: hypothetical protein K2P80_04155 [Beijerinckiaceae bacterium]|nr:hypothetical protein [Beijerinckiaceae bacterium]